MRVQSFVKGAAILGAAALITKLLGVLSRIPFQNMTGNEGLFIYSRVYPLYGTLLAFATAGFPVAVSKMVSERLALGDSNGAKRVFHVSSIVLTVTGTIFFCVLYFCAPLIASWMNYPNLLTLPIRSVSFALLIVPFMSVMRGYFQGQQNMVPTAVSQVAEQLIRVITIVGLAFWFMQSGFDVVYASAGAVFGAVTGAVTALLTLLFFWFRNLKDNAQLAAGSQADITEYASFSREPVMDIVKRIVYYAIPICIGSLVLPFFGLVDTFTIGRVLENAAGLSAAHAVNLNGIYDRGQPLIQFSAFFATAMALSIVPAISEAAARQEDHLVAKRSELALRMTYLFGLPASVGLAVIAGPVNILLFTDDSGTMALAILAFTTIFSTLGMTSTSVLQGLGWVVLPARHLFVGVCVKLVLNLILIGPFQIAGAAVATVIGYAVATGLNLRSLKQRIKLKASRRHFRLKPIIATLIMTGAVYVVMTGTDWGISAFFPNKRLAMLVTVFAAVVTGVSVYTVALFRSGMVTRDDLEAVPKLNRLLTPWLERLRLLS